jgi:hypothetical protein
MGTTIRVEDQQGGGGGAVASVFGRTGTVTAQNGDYSVNQISGLGLLIDFANPILVNTSTYTITNAQKGKAIFFVGGGLCSVTINASTLDANFQVYCNAINNTTVDVVNSVGQIDYKARRRIYNNESMQLAINPFLATDIICLYEQNTPSATVQYFRDGTINTNTVLVPPTGANTPNASGQGVGDFQATLMNATVTVNELTTNNATSYSDIQFAYVDGNATRTGLFSAGQGTLLGPPVRIMYPNTSGAGRFDFTKSISINQVVPAGKVLYCYISGQSVTSLTGITCYARFNDIK